MCVHLGYEIWGMNEVHACSPGIWDLGYEGTVGVLLGYGIWDMKVLRVLSWDMGFGI